MDYPLYLTQSPNFLTFQKAKEQKYNSFVHFTPHFEEIIESGQILCSGGGGLGFGIYLVPLQTNGADLYKAHNLGDFIAQFEIPFYTGSKFHQCIIIDTESTSKALDYTTFGEFVLQYNSSSLIQNFEDLYLSEMQIYDNLKKHRLKSNIEAICEQSKVFATLCFEATQDLILLYQQTEQSHYYAECNELYISGFKYWLYDSQAYLKQGFTTKKFKISYNDAKNIKTIFNIQHDPDVILGILQDILIHKYEIVLQSKGGLKGFLLGRIITMDRMMGKYLGEYIKSIYGDNLIYGYPIPKGEFLLNGSTAEMHKIKVYSGRYDFETKLIEKLGPINIKIGNNSVPDDKVILRRKSI